VYWSQPEVLLYDPDPNVRFSYPDFFEDEGRYFVTETQKTIARVHEIDCDFLNILFQQGSASILPRDKPLVEMRAESTETERPLEGTIDLSRDDGFTVEIHATFDRYEPGATLVDNRDDQNRGFVLSMDDEYSLVFTMGDGKNTFSWSSDVGTIQVGKQQHIVVIVDSGPQLVMFVVDGQLCDGGEQRQQGWGRWKDPLGQVTGSRVRINPAFPGRMQLFRVYGRPLRVSEAVSLYRAM